MPETTPDRPNTGDIVSLLAAGVEAKKKQYLTMLSRIARGETLTSGDLRAFDALDKELRLIGDVSPAPGGVPAATLPNIISVVDYLAKHGWKIAKSAAYKHRAEGKIRPTKTGAFLVSDVENYASTYLQKLEYLPSSGNIEGLQRDQAVENIRKARAQADHWELKTRIAASEFVPRDLFERELAARAATFRSDVENFIRGHAAGVVAIAEGNVQKIPDLIEYMLDQSETWLSRYSEDKQFEVDATAYEKIFSAATDDELSTEEDEDSDDDTVAINEGG